MMSTAHAHATVAAWLTHARTTYPGFVDAEPLIRARLAAATVDRDPTQLDIADAYIAEVVIKNAGGRVKT
jgi:hypothetical protein